MKNEKHYIRKYRLLLFALLIVMIASMLVVYLTVKSPTVVLFGFLVICIANFFVTRIIIRKVLLSVLLDDLDAPLFRKIVKKGKFAGLQLWSEYYCGNFGNVVELCRKKLADYKAAKKGRYMYLQNLAAVYYITGDSESLRAVCREVEEYLKTEKPSAKRKQAAYIKIFDFYNAYLAGDWESCEKIDERQVKTKLDRITRAHTHARLALAKGELERAKELFEEIRQAPNLCYAACAEEGLRAIEEGRPYGEGFAPLSVTDDFYVMYPSKVAALLSRISIVCFVIAFILLWVVAGLELQAMKEAERLEELQNQQSKVPDPQKGQQLSQNLEKYEEHIGKLGVMLQTDYDNATVLKVLNLLNNSNEILESMFLFRDDENIFLATCYILGENTDTYYYRVQATLPLNALGEENMIRDFSFACVTSESSATVRFCLKMTGIPPTAKGYLTFDVNQKTVYFVLLSIQEEA